METTSNIVKLPFKSVATALIFTVLLGPIGLLYASFWGGVLMTALAVFFISCKFSFLTLLVWLGCSIWSTRAVENYNRRLCGATS